MPILITDYNKGLLPPNTCNTVTCEEFKTWITEHSDRVKRNSSVPGVDLGSDYRYISFTKNDILKIVAPSSTKKYLGIIYGCDYGSGKYKKMTAFIFGTDAIGVVPSEIYNNNGSPVSLSTKRKNYDSRIQKLRNHSPHKDYGLAESTGIYHLSTQIFPFIDAITTDNINFWFLKDKDRTTVVLADSSFDPKTYNCVKLTDPALYDHGTACCTIY